jgi:probable HAF family extracellular repeat protein
MLSAALPEDTVTLNHCFKVRSFILTAALIGGLSLANHANAQQVGSYLIDLNSGTVTNLGRGTTAVAINDTGQVGGHFETSEGALHAFITGPNGMGMTDLGTLVEGDWSYVNDINAAGRMVGSSYPIIGASRSFITGPNGVGMTELGTLGGNSEASAINDVGQVAGRLGNHAFITGPDGAGVTDLGTLGGDFGQATDINNAGQVVGSSSTAGNREIHAFITGPSGMGMTDLGTLGSDYSIDSIAYGVNDAGQVVGDSYTTEVNTLHAFITDPDGVGIRDLGVLSGDSQSSAWGINNDGQAVGYSGTSEGNFRAFITGTDGEGMVDLNSLVDLPGVVLMNATDINNNGQVIAVGVIPEPETYALMLAGLGLVGFIATRRKSNILLG